MTFQHDFSKSLHHIFTTFFHASINEGTIPTGWKEAFVVPIFKKRDKFRASNVHYRADALTVVTYYILEHILCSSVTTHLEPTYLGHSCNSSLLMTSRNTYSHLQLVYLQMTVYYTERSKMKLTRSYSRKTWTTYSDGNVTGKWSFIPVYASFYVSATNVDHLP